MASNRSQVKVEMRKGARNSLRKADSHCHGTGRERTREGCARLKIQKKVEMVRGENSTRPWSMSEVNATTATFSLVEDRQGSHLAAVWKHDIDTATEGLPKSIRRRWHTTLEGTQISPGAACVGSTCGLQPFLEKVIFFFSTRKWPTTTRSMSKFPSSNFTSAGQALHEVLVLLGGCHLRQA